MKKLLLCFLVFLVLDSCKKSNPAPAGSASVNGILHYDNLIGGLGLYYVTDAHNTMIFQDEFSPDPHDSLEYFKYNYFVGVNSTLNYIDSGETGCYDGNPSICGFTLVKIVSIKAR